MPRASAAFSGLKRMWLASATWKMPSLNEEVTRLRKRRRNPRTRNRVHRARRKVTRHSVRSGASEPGQGGTSARQHALTSAPDRSAGQAADEGRGADDAGDGAAHEDAEVDPVARGGAEEEAAQRRHLVGQGVDVADDLEPARHHLDRVERVGGEEEGHGDGLPDAHESVEDTGNT